MIEDGTYPGLEAGIEEAIEAQELINEEELANEQQAQLGGPSGQKQLPPPQRGMEGQTKEQADAIWQWREELHTRVQGGSHAGEFGVGTGEKEARARAAVTALKSQEFLKRLKGIKGVARMRGKGVVKATSEKSGQHPGPGYSADAYIDSNGVMHTTNVYDAQRALFENRRVDLKQPKQVTTLIKRLGETALEMAESGSVAPTFNLCNVTIKGTNLFCADQIGIPRVEMPVIRASKTADFVKYLGEQGYKIEEGREKAANLRASQSELSGEKVAASMQRITDEGKFYKRIVISRDDYILDGHHTWAGQLAHDAADNDLENDGRRVKIARIDIGIVDLIAEAEKWTGGEGKKAASQRAKGLGDADDDDDDLEGAREDFFTFGDALRAWNEALHERVQGGAEAGQFGSGSGTSKLERARAAVKALQQAVAGKVKTVTGMAEATPDKFVAARDKSTRSAYLSAHPAEELADHTLLLNDSDTVGISVDKEGDVQNIFNNGGPKGGAQKAMIAAIENGGRTLDCYDGFLPKLYHQFGFEEDQRMKFNPEFAPQGWDFEADDNPDIVFMSWRGYGEGGAQAALARAANRSTWATPDKAKDYTDDWDAAKSSQPRSRSPRKSKS